MGSSRPLAFSRTLTAAEADALVAGVKPAVMEDKWFVFCEDGVVHLHRSWTGAEIYALTLDRHADGSADIVEVRVTDTLEDDARAAEILDVVLSSL